MQRLATLVVSLLVAVATFAQVPNGFSYQAVVRNAQNAIVANQTIDVSLFILQGETPDAAKIVYTENHSVTTNVNGLFTLSVGGGKTTDSFSTINWSIGNFYLKTESTFGTSIVQLLSVPFAMYAAKAAEVEIDLSGYALKTDIPATPDLSGFALKSEIPSTPDLSDYALKTDLPTVPSKTSELLNDSGFLISHQDLSGKQDTIPDLASIRSGAALGATALQEHQSLADYAKTADIKADYALKSEIPTKMSDLKNDNGFITEHQSLADYAKTAEIEKTYAKISDIPTTPTKTSDLQNDSGFLTSHQDLSGYYSKTEVDSLLAIFSTYTDIKTVSVTAAENGIVKGASGIFYSGQSITYTAVPNEGYYFKCWSDDVTENPRTILIYSDVHLTAIFVQTFLVTITAGDNGTVSGPENGRYEPGSSLTFIATPNDGYYFSQWSDGNTSNPRNVSVNTDDITFSAEFAQKPLITVTAGNNGSVSGSENGRYAPGSSLSFTATPSTGYFFSRWSDGNTSNPRSINVNTSNITIEAEFISVSLATVDLGLPSGNLWTLCNVGATSPEEYGDYFAWGEVTPYYEDGHAYDNPCYNWKTGKGSGYDWPSYKYCKGSYDRLTKYCYFSTYGENGFTDNLTTLESVDDAATVALGSDYSTPTKDDWDELIKQCYWEWTSDYNSTGVCGRIVYKAKVTADKGKKSSPSASYSLSDAHIFLPVFCGRIVGSYWSSTLFPKDGYMSSRGTTCAYELFINSGSVSLGDGGRNGGCAVRAVCRP